ncbi:CD9 antigen [Armadillidium nasatum]|uniref:CD9 antigen n=1 Tax=Armadillidium nasatum TaxID=96803 RepID=A0A5N5SMS9_9CRUS|nr:CD9 antigen [Armadillidium nasatum]
MIMAVGFYICLDDDFREYMKDLDMYSYMAGVYILLVAGVLVILMAFFGICGAYLKKPGMLLIFLILMGVAFVLEIAGASYLLANGTKNSKMTVVLQTNLYNLISRYNYDVSAKRSLDIVQQWIGCCGSLGIADYVNWNILIPTSCYDPITGNAW